ncbi:MAG: NADH-quinone oxidoreductase subunit NuoF [Emcibacter sp.]|nr:NADH-quinone oxidoreductase subunit NuoF [Emcibacter sp.]
MTDLVTLYVPLETTALSLGADELVLELLAEAEKRDQHIEIIRNGSWGISWLEPLVEVVTDQGRMAYGNVMAEDVTSLFDANFLSGGKHPLSQGLTAEIPYLKTQDRLTFARCGLIDSLSLQEYQANDGFAGLEKALKMAPQAIVDQVTESGLRGRGGAAFPTGIKWNTVLGASAQQKYICCNADEGDSGTFADRILMESDPYCLIEGMIIAGLAVGATEGYIYLRSEYPLCQQILEEALINARNAGWLGQNIKGSGQDFDIEVRMGAGSYVCGEETAMLNSLEGKRGMVRAKPPLPALEGLFGEPTVVNNVLSLASVPIIMDKGAEFYRDFGMGRSRGTIAFQLAGNIARGGLVEKAFGISLRELIMDYGDGTLTPEPLKAVQVGGPLGAYLGPDDLEIPMDYEAFSEAGAVLGHGGIVVFDTTVDMAEQAKFAFDFCVEESCGKCTPCRIGSVRGVELLEKIQAGENPEQNLNLVKDLCDVMENGSLCAMGGMTPIPVLSALAKWPNDFKAKK